MGIFVFRRKTPRREIIYPPELSQLVTVSSVKGIPIPNEKVIKNRMGIFVFRRKTPRRENIYPPELPQLVTFSSVKGIPQRLE
jgi:hypothetical protein